MIHHRDAEFTEVGIFLTRAFFLGVLRVSAVSPSGTIETAGTNGTLGQVPCNLGGEGRSYESMD
jgi:hypothetical protein